MVSRYHWLDTAYDTPYLAGGSSMPDLELFIPAGATLKRFLTRQTRVVGSITGFGNEYVNPQYMNFSVDLIFGEYGARNIYKTTRAIPFQVAATYQPPGVGPSSLAYSQWNLACDQELAINQKTSYGTIAGEGFLMRLTSYITQAPGTPNVLGGFARC